MGDCNEFIIGIVVIYVVYKLMDCLLRLQKIECIAERYILVVGADCGFGYELSKRLDILGCRVIATCYCEERRRKLQAECSSRVVTYMMNITDSGCVRDTYNQIRDQLTTAKGLWAIVHTSATADKLAPLEWLTKDDFGRTLDFNFLGLVDVTLTFLPLLKRSKGRVIFTSSVMGRISPNGNPYVVSKYALEAFADGLRRQLLHQGCSVHLVEPGLYRLTSHPSTIREMQKGLSRAWKEAPVSGRAGYDDGFFHQCVQALNLFMKSISSNQTDEVLDAYEAALFGQMPRARYVVGTDAKYIWLPLQWLPEWASDRIMQLGSSLPTLALKANSVRDANGRASQTGDL